MKFFLLFTLLASISLSARIQTPYSSTISKKIPLWEPVDIVFEHSDKEAAPSSPFDLAFTATFKGPDDTTLIVSAYYSSERTYTIRFSPSRLGKWTFLTSSELSSLDSLEGSLTVTAAQPAQKGPIETKQQSFQYADGSSYLPIAFECDWLFAIDAENPDDIPKTKLLTNEISQNGFNQVVMNVFAYDVAWKPDPNLPEKYNYAKPKIFPFGGSNDDPNHGTLNLEFFDHFDRVMDQLQDSDLIAHLMIYVWNKKVNWPESKSEEDNRYFDYIIKRYQAYPNLIWDISKEATGYGHNDMGYITDRISRLRSLDAHKRILTVHDYGYCVKNPNEVDFISVQIWATELYSAMDDRRKKFPSKPVFNIEHGGYEKGPYRVFGGDYLSAEVCLSRAYQCLFAGVSFAHYWQDTSWSVVIHDPSELPAADQPKFHYYRHLAKLNAEIDFPRSTPVPAQKLSTSGFCLKLHNGGLAYYVPEANASIILKVKKELENLGSYRWFNPMTGEFTKSKSRKKGPFGSIKRPNWPHFAILIVDPIE